MRPILEPRVLLSIAFVLLMTGFVLPLLMVLQVVESTLFLNFFSYTVMVLGSMLGFVGISFLVVRRKRE